MAKMRVTARQYRYPDTRSGYEKAQARMDEVEIPVNRKQRTGTVRMIRT